MNYANISIEMFQNLVSKSLNPSLVCENGLSINFEPKLTLDNLGENMYAAHLHVIKFADYQAISPKMEQVFLPNYKAVIKYLKKNIHNKADFSRLFFDAVIFAKSIITSQVLDWISDNKFDEKLAMGFGPLDYVTDLIKQIDDTHSAFKINYEFWSILIYFALILLQAPSTVYILPKENKFIKTVAIGAGKSPMSKPNTFSEYIAKTCENGMFSYLRILLSTNILLIGNGYYIEKMSKWGVFREDVLKSFFEPFNHVLTTNYDLLIEKITGRTVLHLHGRFTRQPQVVLGQSIGVYVDAVRYDLSSILIGDYFIAKCFYAITAQMAQKSLINTNINFYQEVLKETIQKKKSDTIVIFGLDISNDYHIIRNLQVSLSQSGLSRANIIFCYFNQKDDLAFKKAYESCVTYADEVNEYVRNHISVYTIDSHSILQHFFVKKA